jgi:hypothetical protein
MLLFVLAGCRKEPGADCNHDSDLVSIQVQCTNAVVEADRGGAY